MDILAIIGLLVGFVTVVLAMILKEIPFSALVQPAAFVVIFMGTIAAVVIATPASEIKSVGSLFGVIFGKQRFIKKEDAAKSLVEYAKIARKDGLLSLETQAANENDKFMARGLQLLVDGVEPESIEESLSDEIEAMQVRHAAGAQIFSQAGTYAPTLGVLGAVMGLIAALGDLSDMDKLSHAISAAFIATVLGIFTGYVMWNPMANRLKRKSQQEVQVKTMIMQGILGISGGKNPQLLEENMMAFLTEKERKKAGMGQGGKE